jgi:hypothetical protein
MIFAQALLLKQYLMRYHVHRLGVGRRSQRQLFKVISDSVILRVENKNQILYSLRMFSFTKNATGRLLSHLCGTDQVFEWELVSRDSLLRILNAAPPQGCSNGSGVNLVSETTIEIFL